MPKSQPKKPDEMTTDEAVKHLFHPKVVKHLKDAVETANARPEKGKSVTKDHST